LHFRIPQILHDTVLAKTARLKKNFVIELFHKEAESCSHKTEKEQNTRHNFPKIPSRF